MGGDCPDFAVPWEQNGTVPLSEADLLDALREQRLLHDDVEVVAVGH